MVQLPFIQDLIDCGGSAGFVRGRLNVERAPDHVLPPALLLQARSNRLPLSAAGSIIGRCSWSLRPMPPRSAPPLIRVASCPPQSSCAGGFQASRTTKPPAPVPGRSLAGRRCQCRSRSLPLGVGVPKPYRAAHRAGKNRHGRPAPLGRHSEVTPCPTKSFSHPKPARSRRRRSRPVSGAPGS